MREEITQTTALSRTESADRPDCPRSDVRRGNSGTSLVEVAIILGIMMILLGIGYPHFDTAMRRAQLNAAATSASWAIQSTRYQAIMKGYPYQLAFTTSNNKFQVSSDSTWPGATTFTNVGSAVPLTAQSVTLSANTTFQFSGNGSVSATVGAMNFQISYMNMTKTITVSNYGSVTIQ